MKQCRGMGSWERRGDRASGEGWTHTCTQWHFKKSPQGWLHPQMSDSLRPHGLYCPWNSPGKNTGVGSLSLLQGVFPTQGLNPRLLHCRRILDQLSHKGSPLTYSSSAPKYFVILMWIPLTYMYYLVVHLKILFATGILQRYCRFNSRLLQYLQ